MKKYKIRGLGKMCFQDYVLLKLNLILDRIGEYEKKQIAERNMLEDLMLMIEDIKNEKEEKKNKL